MNLLIKPASSLCNLRCCYCFYADESANRVETSMGLMTEHTVEALLREAYSAADERGFVSFAFHGGEPTAAGLAFFWHFTARARELKPQCMELAFTIQANGTLLDEDWARFFLAEDYLVGISPDGCPEIPSFYPNLTVEEHMEFLARAYRLRTYREHAEALLRRFSLDEHRSKLGSELSKGLAQKLNICLGLLTRPSVVLLDEPFIGLDPHAIKELKNTVEELRAGGAALLISTHIIDSVDMLWDRTIILKGGKMRCDVTREELNRSGESLEKLFFKATEGA